MKFWRLTLSNVKYLHNWNPELCIQLETDYNQKADFNRFLVKNFPPTSDIQRGKQFEDAQRESHIIQLKSRFDEAIAEGGSQSTLNSLFKEISQYLRWCDKESVIAFTQSSLEGYMHYQNERVMLGQIQSSTYTVSHARMTTIFIKLLDLPSSYFSHVVIRDRCDTEPFTGYTRSDLKQMMPFLRSLFKQTYRQFICNPEEHIKAYKSTATMIFYWKGREYKLCSAISKMMCAGTFLMAYYTFANSSDLFKLRQPKNASTSLKEVWFTLPVFKRRAFKTIRVEMGSHDLEIPKYSMDFFDKLLNASKLLSNNEDAFLLQTVVSKRVQPISSITLQGFLKNWMEKHFSLTDQTGRRLRPVVSRFRETGAQLTAYHQGEIASAIIIGNTPNVRRKHYSEGNKHTNNGMMQDTLAIREEKIRNDVDTEQAKDNLGIDVLVIEKEYAINMSKISRTSSGGSCKDPFGSKSKKYTRKAQKQGLAKEGERLACADLLGCFGCASQVIVQSVANLWCLLSFRTCIDESLYLHLNAHHYRKNFEQVMAFIDSRILPKINPKILKQAEKKLNDDGLHPAWAEPESLLYLIPNKLKKSS